MSTVPDEQIWDQIRREAARDAESEPALAAHYDSTVLRHPTLEDSLSCIRADKLESPALVAMTLRDLIGRALAADPAIGVAVRADLQAVITRDPARSGETAVVEDDFSMLHEVTLGGTGRTGGDRHPKIRRGVMIGAGAKVLGNIVVGEGAKIEAGSVVLDDVPAHTTVAGVPARPVSFPAHSFPALDMDQSLDETGLFDGLDGLHAGGRLP